MLYLATTFTQEATTGTLATTAASPTTRGMKYIHLISILEPHLLKLTLQR